MNTELYNYLSRFVLERRMELFKRIIEYRTRYITVILEDAFQAQNASAVIRTCDCFGIQDLHFIENKNKFRLDKNVTMGSDKWLDIYTYDDPLNNTRKSIQHIKGLGYRIIAMSLNHSNIELNDFDMEKGKIALLFGTELTGLSDDAISEADEFIRIPMYGFTESYNLSVAVALTLQFMVNLLHKMKKITWQLKEDEKIEVILKWMRKSIRRVDLIEKRFYTTNISK